MITTQKVVFEKRASAFGGTYWTSNASKATLRQHLRDCNRTTLKTASIGGDQEASFEQSFSSLAYAYLKDKSPRLLDFIVGFQLVDRNEDNTKAVGIFGFKVGEQWLYGPTFFLNGDLKGHELLYIKNQDTFVPMKENWVNYLISRKPHILGESSGKTTFELGGLMPSLTKLTRPPANTKYGSAPHIDDWVKPFMPFVGAAATRAESVFKKHAGLDAKFDMRNFLTEFPLLKMAFEKAYCSYPLVKRGFDRFYGTDFFYSMGMKIREKVANQEIDLVKEAKSYILPPKEVKKRKLSSQFILADDEPMEHPIKSGALRVIKLADEMKTDEDAPGGIKVNKPDLTEEEREKLLKDTVLIKDKRDASQTSIAYNTQMRLEAVNPTETGLYNILEKPGSFDEMLVIYAPQTGRGRETFALVVRKSDPRNWLNTHPTNLWAKQNADNMNRTDFIKYVEGLSGVDSLKKDGHYVAIGPSGAGTGVFRVKEDYGDGAYKVEWKDYCQYNQDRATGLPRMEHGPSDYESGYSSWDAKIFINQRDGTGLRSVNGELSIPKEFKILEVKAPPKPKKEDAEDSILGCSPCFPSSESSETNPIQPGNLIDIQIMLTSKEAKLQLHDTGGEIHFKSRNGDKLMSKMACLLSLVTEHGLSEKQARTMLKEAAVASVHNRACSYFIKYANPFNNSVLAGGPNAPSFPAPWMGVENNGPNAVSSIYPQEEFQPIPGMDSGQYDQSIYDPFYQPDQNAMQVAQQASNSGQKEVFDTAMVSGMLKAVRQDSLVDRYLGDLMKALDKLGRILFMFYWHQEEFEDRYGKADLPELEDSLRNAFEVLGDVCLFLKEKTVAGGAGVEMAGVGGPDRQDPSIEEAARN